jgi:hypothetical protein
MATQKIETIRHIHEVHISFDNALETKSNEAKLDRILELLLVNKQKLKNMANEIEDLQKAVARETEVDQSAIVLINGLKQKLDDAIASNDPAQLRSLSDLLGASSQQLADAVTANTPTSPAP